MKFLRTIIFRLDQMLMDSVKKQKWSSARFTYVFTVSISNIFFWSLFLWLTIATGSFPIVSMELVYIYGMANGFAIGGKYLQKQQEVKESLGLNGHVPTPGDEEEAPEDESPPPE